MDYTLKTLDQPTRELLEYLDKNLWANPVFTETGTLLRHGRLEKEIEGLTQDDLKALHDQVLVFYFPQHQEVRITQPGRNLVRG